MLLRKVTRRFLYDVYVNKRMKMKSEKIRKIKNEKKVKKLKKVVDSRTHL